MIDPVKFLDAHAHELRDPRPKAFSPDAVAVIAEADRRRKAGESVSLNGLCRLLIREFGIQYTPRHVRNMVLAHLRRSQW